MLYRLPTNELLRPYLKSILSLMLRLLEIDNEENVLICLKIIIELHKQYRPAFNSEVSETVEVVLGCIQFCFLDRTFSPVC